jgi:hypothetical protein
MIESLLQISSCPPFRKKYTWLQLVNRDHLHQYYFRERKSHRLEGSKSLEPHQLVLPFECFPKLSEDSLSYFLELNEVIVGSFD